MPEAAHRRGLAFIHLATLMAGATGLFGKWVTAGPSVITGGRTLVAFLTLIVVARIRGIPLRIAGGRRRALTLLSGVLLAAHWWTFFHAIAVSSVSVTLLALASYPLFTVLLEPLVFREKYRGGDFAAAAVVAAGLALVGHDGGAAAPAGLAWGMLSGAIFSGVALISRAVVSDTPPVTVAANQQFAAMLVSLPFALAAPGVFEARPLILVAILGLVFTAGLQTLFVAGLRHVGARTASIVLMLEPVYGIAFAWAVFGERPTVAMLAGGALIGGAAGAVTLAHAKTRRRHSA